MKNKTKYPLVAIDVHKQNIIEKTEMYVRGKLDKEYSGHGWFHVDRVRKLAVYIAKQENIDTFIVTLASLLHDIADWKFHDGNEEIGPQKARVWLESLEVEDSIISSVATIIKNITFKGAGVKTPTLSIEGQIVQDSDRLDAMGAIGIARAFAFGGKKGQEMHNPDLKPSYHFSFKDYKLLKTTTVNHFYEKLLLLKEKMNTATGKKIS